MMGLLKWFYDSDKHPGIVVIPRMLGSFAIAGVVLAALMGYGWPWAPTPDSSIGDSWLGLRVAFAVWAVIEVGYFLAQFNRSK